MSNSSHFILDPTEIHPAPEGWQIIESEAQWLRDAQRQGGRFWVRGRFLCDWTRQWLKGWEMETAIDGVKAPPREELCRTLALENVPATLSEREALDLATKLAALPADRQAARFLAQETGHEAVWLGSPSRSHLAEWLQVEVAEPYKFIEQVWQRRLADESEGRLKGCYLTEDKSALLRQWLGLEPAASIGLGSFPLAIPALLAKEFDDLWTRRIIESEGRVLDALRPHEQAGMERISETAHKVFLANPRWLSRERLNVLSGHLNESAWQDLMGRIPPPLPRSLAVSATVAEALQWAIEQYLPYRAWEVRYGRNRELSLQLAGSFEEWVCERYPPLKTDAADGSPLNYSVNALVRSLSSGAPVLWVVVDGLGWLDHLRLLAIFSDKTSLRLVQPLTPKISILPTKTEYAKWSLYAELLPASEHWKADAGDGFKFVGWAGRYTDGQFNRLVNEIAEGQRRVYCWDSTTLDELYHAGHNWDYLQATGIPNALGKIAAQIEYLVNRHPQTAEMKVVICTDHGQMLGSPQHGEAVAAEVSGRMGKGEIDDDRFLNLPRGRFGLPHDIFVARGDACYSNTESGRGLAAATHGGLLPEEVIAGVSVLQKNVTRLPVIVTCAGEGTAGRPGTLKLWIRNANPVPLHDVTIYLDQIAELRAGKSVSDAVPANGDRTIALTIGQTPAPEINADADAPGSRVALSGRIIFKFSGVESGEAEISGAESVFTVSQIFQSGGMEIDEFL